MQQPPSLGRIVIYRSRTGSYSMPAMITAIQASLYQPNVDAGHIAPITAETNVHLAVFTAGKPGHVSEETVRTHPELVVNPAPAGVYQEDDIPYWEPESGAWTLEDQPAGTWTWPSRI